MRASCEVIVKTFLPAMRAQIAKELSAKGYTQTQIADILGLTQAAVSKYLGDKLYPDVRAVGEQAEVKDTARKIANGLASKKFSKSKAINEMCSCCKMMRESHKLCPYHEAMLPGISKSCDLCSHKSK